MTRVADAGERFVDLHLHTTHSDGRLRPAQSVAEASALGLIAIAITDHDVLDGVPEAQAAGERLGIEVVAGIELTADWEGRSAHLLGYFVDPAHPALLDALDRAKAAMGEHVRRVLDRARELGERIDEAALARYRARYVSGASLILGMLEQGVLRRGHARELLVMASREPRAYTALEAIELIHRAGGLASLAHPVRLKRGQPLLTAEDLRPLVEGGLDGVEVWQIVHSNRARAHYAALALELGLVATGGSDCHGPTRRGLRMGTQQVPEWVLSEMKARRRRQPAG
jgi:predicted metal-dependent phosphoesterase TrpH